MRKDKMTQKKAVFYLLWQSYKENPEAYLPTWKFVGEMHVKELGIYFLMSYKCPTNGLDIYHENEGLIERRWVRGKSNAKYFEYRIAPNPSIAKIKDEAILQFYRAIKAHETK